MEKWREDLYLSHHGILGMSWGKKNGPPYPLDAEDHSSAEKKAGWMKSLSSKAKELKSDISKKRAKAKRAKQLKKARAAKAKKEEERKKAEALAADRDRALKYGTASEVMRYKKQISRQEAKEIRDRLNDMAAIEEYYKKEKESKSAWHKLDKVMKRVDQARDWAEKGTKAWNTFAKISNSLFDTELKQISDNPLKQDNKKKDDDDDDDDSAMREVLKLLKEQNKGESGNKKEKSAGSEKEAKSSEKKAKGSGSEKKAKSSEKKAKSSGSEKDTTSFEDETSRDDDTMARAKAIFESVERERRQSNSSTNSGPTKYIKSYSESKDAGTASKLYSDSKSGQDRAKANSEYLNNLVHNYESTSVDNLYKMSSDGQDRAKANSDYLNNLAHNYESTSVDNLYKMSSDAQERARANSDYLNKLIKKG